MQDAVVVGEHPGMTDRQAALIAAAVSWGTGGSDKYVFETAERYLEWLRKDL